MQEAVKQYTILISAPSDINSEILIIKKCFDKFNRGEGKQNKINLLTQYWKDDTFPEQGDTAQNIINKQIVYGCDAAIAIFWNKFGSPTENYGSGTEEELETLQKNGKDVSIYFSEKDGSLTDVDPEQLRKIREFKTRVQQKGLYSTYATDEELEEKLSRHLSSIVLKWGNKKLAKYTPPPCDIINDCDIFSNKFIEAVLRKTLRNDYAEFLHVMQVPYAHKYDQNEKLYSIKGGIPGLFGIAEGLFEFNKNGDVFIVFTQGNKIKYYTNDNRYIQKIPEHIEMQEWFKNKRFDQLIFFNSVSGKKRKAVSGEYKFQLRSVNSATMDITVNEGKLKFIGKARHGANVGNVKGEVILVDGYLAFYQDEKGNKLKFTFFDKKLNIDEQGSFGGINVRFQGEYSRKLI